MPSTFTTGCCPPFDPSLWNDKVITWHDKPFLRASVRAVLHAPVRLERTLRRAMAQVEGAGARPSPCLVLADDRSAWHTDLFVEVTRDVPGASMARLSGTFVTRVFEGPFRDAPKWAAEMQREVRTRGETVERLFFAWTACPSCARASGHKHVVVFARIAPGDETGLAA
jgi:hypothetical protein